MKRKILKIIAGLTVAIFVFACHDSRQRKLESLVKTFSEPITIANMMSIYSVSALPNFTLKMNATWLQDVNIDFARETAQTTSKNSMVRNLYQNKKFMELINEGLVIYFAISDLHGNHISDVYIKSDDFKDDIINLSENEYNIENFRQQMQILQKTLPQKVGDGIVICAAAFNELTGTIEYTWTFEEGYDITYFAASVEDFQNLATQSWKNFVSSNEIIVDFISKGFVWKYMFLDNDKTVLVTAVFDEIEDLN
jgi:hypothetical protein